MVTGITKRDKVLKIVTLVGNIILWVLILPTSLMAFAALFGADAFGTGLYTKFQETLIAASMRIMFFNPLATLIGAIASLVLRIKERYVYSLYMELIPLILILTAIFLMVLVG